MPAPLAFYVQKHAASRLHYDFRLELDGVLKSWAVTRGPSLVAGERRLAVQVEDHQLGYGSFEGVIGEGSYGAGTVLLWDRGIWEPEGDPNQALTVGSLSFTLQGSKLMGRWRLRRMKPRSRDRHVSWLLIKADDAAACGPNDADILEQEPRSVASGRTIEEIAASAP